MKHEREKASAKAKGDAGETAHCCLPELQQQFAAIRKLSLSLETPMTRAS
jgi:hypothetical protein